MIPNRSICKHCTSPDHQQKNSTMELDKSLQHVNNADTQYMLTIQQSGYTFTCTAMLNSRISKGILHRCVANGGTRLSSRCVLRSQPTPSEREPTRDARLRHCRQSNFKLPARGIRQPYLAAGQAHLRWAVKLAAVSPHCSGMRQMLMRAWLTDVACTDTSMSVPFLLLLGKTWFSQAHPGN